MHIQTDVVRRIERILGSAHVGTFSDIGEHAPVAGITAGVRALIDSGADAVISVGGGSPIDAAKAIVYRIREQTFEAKFIPHIAVPTTLSAAEYTVSLQRERRAVFMVCVLMNAV